MNTIKFDLEVRIPEELSAESLDRTRFSIAKTLVAQTNAAVKTDSEVLLSSSRRLPEEQWGCPAVITRDTDDVGVAFDAEPGLSMAADKVLAEMLYTKCAQSRAIDGLAQTSKDPLVNAVLDYCDLTDTGFTVELDLDAVTSWIKAHRPKVLEQ